MSNKKRNKLKPTPSGKRLELTGDNLIVSKTNIDSIITYANECFCQISGYRPDELVGQPQNIVRHPAMPKAIFELMWQHLNQSQEFFGYILNLCKDGSEYWTFAHVTPICQQGNLHGYISVRRAAKKDITDELEILYKKMLALEKDNNEQSVAKSLALLWNEINKDYQSYAEYILSR